MDVDVDLVGGQFDEEDGGGAGVADAARVGFAQGVGDRRRGGGASVDEHVLVAPGGGGEVRTLDVARDGDAVDGGRRQREGAFEVVFAEEVADAVGGGRGWREAIDLASVDREREADGRMGDGVDGEDVADVALLRRVGAEEFPPGGHVAEEVAHFDERAGGAAGGADLGDRPRVDLDERAFVVRRPPGGEGEAGDGGDGGDGLAAEAERVDLLDVGDVADLRGGLAFEGEDGVVARHAAAVVLHGDEPPPALRHRDGYPARPGVYRVFYELLDDGRRALHHLARGDLVRHVERQHPHVSVALRSQGSGSFV